MSNTDLVCCPFCLSIDPNKVGTEKATGITCRHEFHCPVPETHGNPFRYCPYCNWTETNAKVYQLDEHRAFDIGTPTRCYRCGASVQVLPTHGDGGYVWACPKCPHPADR
jgi:ribosomal protein S27AE